MIWYPSIVWYSHLLSGIPSTIWHPIYILVSYLCLDTSSTVWNPPTIWYPIHYLVPPSKIGSTPWAGHLSPNLAPAPVWPHPLTTQSGTCSHRFDLTLSLPLLPGLSPLLPFDPTVPALIWLPFPAAPSPIWFPLPNPQSSLCSNLTRLQATSQLGCSF